MALAPKKTDEEIEDLEDDIVIEVDDDTPDEDRGRDVAPDDTENDKDGEADDEELKNYSQEAARRIRILTKKKHDERRAKESAIRVRDEAVNTAKSALSEVEKLRAQLNSTTKVAVGAAKGQYESDLVDLRKQMADAIDAADGAKVAELTEKISDTRTKLNNATHAEKRLETEKPEEVENKGGTDPNDPANWPKARQKWAKRNADWFGKDDEMTALAYGVHGKIVREGEIEVDSPEYFEAIDKRMRKVFPDKFEDKEDDDDFDFEDDDEKPKKKPGKAKERVSDFGNGPVVKSVTTKGKTVYKLKASQRELCKKLGISEADYVKAHIAKERAND